MEAATNVDGAADMEIQQKPQQQEEETEGEMKVEETAAVVVEPAVEATTAAAVVAPATYTPLEAAAAGTYVADVLRDGELNERVPGVFTLLRCGCCELCALRFLGQRTFSLYREPLPVLFPPLLLPLLLPCSLLSASTRPSSDRSTIFSSTI
jgi:hypothetical protein